MTDQSPLHDRLLPLILFGLSFCLLAGEVVLLRVLSYLQWYHFAYLVISLALLGFGASGTLLHLFRPFWQRTHRLRCRERVCSWRERGRRGHASSDGSGKSSVCPVVGSCGGVGWSGHSAWHAVVRDAGQTRAPTLVVRGPTRIRFREITNAPLGDFRREGRVVYRV